MSDMGEMYRDMKEYRKALRRAFGIPCPACNALEPKRDPTILLPGQRCKVDGYKDARSRLTNEEIFKATGIQIQEVKP